ncbi:MAG TPA: polysaccharide biosynthesis C-terminal domain-containing protein, partial [Gammaproteobacteria bacterium]|nr:polysaccharide biosynthesis C-terminal domain-containing protein [Gammaproteobacteria bacterium]
FVPFRTILHGGTLGLVAVTAATVGVSAAPTAMRLTAVASILGLGVALFWALQASRPDIRRVRPEYHTRYWIRTSLPMLVMLGMSLVMNQLDTIMLGAINGTDAAGLYFPLARMSQLAAFGLLSANAIVAPMISELHTAGQRDRLQRLLTLAAIGTSAITLTVVVGFWLFGEWILGLFGAEFVAGYPALLVLLLGQVVNAFCGPVGFMMTMTGHQDRASLVVIGGALVNATLNALLIPQYGIMGASVATGISIAFWNLWMLFEVWRRHRLNTSVFARWPNLRF